MNLIWLFAIIILTILELVTVNLATIWFIVSAIVALILSIFVDNFYLEFGVFVILGVILLVTTRPLLLRFLNKTIEPTNIDRIVGMKGIVLQDIEPDSLGEVKVDGKIWSAFSDEFIENKEKVEILEIKGTKLKVRRVN